MGPAAGIDSIKMNTVAIAKAAVATGIPLVLTSSMEDQAQGPLFTELQEAAPEAYKNRIQRAGVVDCMENGAFAEAVVATGRKNLIMVGITTDVCVVYPAISAMESGYSVQVVVDACGSLLQLCTYQPLIFIVIYTFLTDFG
jgi:nicotinamidase-related amidase